jgi:hypothetical protein
MLDTTLTVTHQKENVRIKNIPALRYSFITASILILLGVTLSHYMHPYFIGLAVLVAGGLLFSGIMGWCPMSLFFEYFLRKKNAKENSQC